MSFSSTEQLRAIIRTQTDIVAGDLDPAGVMQLIAERAQELTRASAGVIELAEGEEMVYAVAARPLPTWGRDCRGEPASRAAA